VRSDTLRITTEDIEMRKITLALSSSFLLFALIPVANARTIYIIDKPCNSVGSICNTPENAARTNDGSVLSIDTHNDAGVVNHYDTIKKRLHVTFEYGILRKDLSDAQIQAYTYNCVKGKVKKDNGKVGWFIDYLNKSTFIEADSKASKLLLQQICRISQDKPVYGE
jgi:hypothetical protein